MDLRSSSSSSSNLLEESLSLNQNQTHKGIILIEDCVETSGAFLLHHLIKRSLSSASDAIVFLAFSNPFSHYDRILRKLGCNLSVQRENRRFLFIDKFMPENLREGVNDEEKTKEGCLVALYGIIRNALEVSGSSGNKSGNITIMIDDISILEVAVTGSSNHVLDFIHYCLILTSEFGCSLIILNHNDIYSGIERPMLLLQMEYLADILIKVEPLATGLATDVHGQLTILNKGNQDWQKNSKNELLNLHFRVKDSCVEYFYPGSRR